MIQYVSCLNGASPPRIIQYSAALPLPVAPACQYQLWGQGTSCPSGASVSGSRVSATVFPLTGKAMPGALSELARLRGQQFSYSGVVFPVRLTPSAT